MHRKATPKGVVEAATDHRILCAVVFEAALDDPTVDTPTLDNNSCTAAAAVPVVTPTAERQQQQQHQHVHQSQHQHSQQQQQQQHQQQQHQHQQEEAPQGQSDSGLTAIVATGSSDGTVRLMHLRAAQHLWVPAAELRNHRGPVLSLVHLQRTVPAAATCQPQPPDRCQAAAAAASEPCDCAPTHTVANTITAGNTGQSVSMHCQPQPPLPRTPPSSPQQQAQLRPQQQPKQQRQGKPQMQQHFLISGSTDGGIAVWDVTAAVASAPSLPAPPPQHLPPGVPHLVAQIDALQVGS